MSGVQLIKIEDGDDGQRIDRWFRNRFPDVTQGRLQKLMRTGQIRLDGGRVKAADRVSAGQEVRVPPNLLSTQSAQPHQRARQDEEKFRKLARELEGLILQIEDGFFVINKPAGLAVQGGSKTGLHVDGALAFLTMGGKEKPRLVHRLDKDTSGALVLARTRKMADVLTRAFKDRSSQKLYWAICSGVANPDVGDIDLPLIKMSGARGEMMAVDHNRGQVAKTRYRVVDTTGREAALMALEPLTGRTHQLRVHCAEIGCPIIGDGKYGMRNESLLEMGIAQKLHLHARKIFIPLDASADVDVTAPLPKHMSETLVKLGLDTETADFGCDTGVCWQP